VEAGARLNQGVHDVNTAITTWMDACFNGQPTVTAATISEGQAAVTRAREAFADVLFRITSSKAVEVSALHAHINTAQTQFNRIEAIWLDVRQGVIGEPPCLNLPEQPGDYVITPWEAENYPEMYPTINQLNRALGLLRQTIQLWEDQCTGYTSTPGYMMPPEAGVTGYNLMLQTRTELNAVYTELNDLYATGGVVVPAPTSTPDPTVQAILHAPYTPSPAPSPTPGYQYVTSVTLTRSTTHPGCAWFGVAGEVRNPDGSPRPATLIHVFGPDFSQHVLSGTDTRYGAAGFEVALPGTVAQGNTYTIRIEDGFGNPLSADQSIQFSADCTLNLTTVTFTAF
jgi:hypothetical protein